MAEHTVFKVIWNPAADCAAVDSEDTPLCALPERSREFWHQGEAVAFARETVKDDYFGAVRIEESGPDPLQLRKTVTLRFCEVSDPEQEPDWVLLL